MLNLLQQCQTKSQTDSIFRFAGTNTESLLWQRQGNSQVLSCVLLHGRINYNAVEKFQELNPQ
jgi:hypothetical protein